MWQRWNDGRIAGLFDDNRVVQGRGNKSRRRCELSGCQAPVAMFPHLPKKTETWATTMNFKRRSTVSRAWVYFVSRPPKHESEVNDSSHWKPRSTTKKFTAECVYQHHCLSPVISTIQLSTRHRKHCKPLHLMFLFLAALLVKQRPADNKN